MQRKTRAANLPGFQNDYRDRGGSDVSAAASAAAIEQQAQAEEEQDEQGELQQVDPPELCQAEYSSRTLRAITMRWISLVPSPISQSLASR